MKPTRLHLVRHGEVDAAWRGRLYGRLDVPLSAAGEAEARRAAALLAGHALAAVVSSGLARAEFGASCLRAARGLGRRDEPDLGELDRGAWAGLTFEELESRDPGAFARWLAAPAEVRPPEGENLSDLSARVLPCIARLAAEWPEREVALVAHSWVIRVAACAALGLDPDACMRLDLPTGGVVTLDWPVESSRAVMGGLNEHRPTLVGFGLDAAPDRARAWSRGVHRG